MCKYAITMSTSTYLTSMTGRRRRMRDRERERRGRGRIARRDYGARQHTVPHIPKDDKRHTRAPREQMRLAPLEEDRTTFLFFLSLPIFYMFPNQLRGFISHMGTTNGGQHPRRKKRQRTGQISLNCIYYINHQPDPFPSIYKRQFSGRRID